MTSPPPVPAAGADPAPGTSLPAYLALHAGRALGGVTHEDGDLPVELVHDARTSLRRLRAMLRTLPDAFEDGAAAEAALQHLALTLGAVRDVDVLTELLPDGLDRLAADGPVTTGSLDAARALLRAALTDLRGRAVASYLREIKAPAWTDGVVLLRRWVEDPPSAPPVEAEELLAEAERRVVERLLAAHGEVSALHSARKAAKRWRYAAELLEGSPAAGTALPSTHLARAQRLQELLGEVQDLEIAVELLGQLRDRPGAADARPALDALAADLRRRQRSAITAARAAEGLDGTQSRDEDEDEEGISPLSSAGPAASPAPGPGAT